MSGQNIGSVGDSGNARGKPAHVHYSMITLIPYLWLADRATLGVEENVLSGSGSQTAGSTTVIHSARDGDKAEISPKQPLEGLDLCFVAADISQGDQDQDHR